MKRNQCQNQQQLSSKENLKYLMIISFVDLDLELVVAADFEQLAQLDHVVNDRVVASDEAVGPRHGGSDLHQTQLKIWQDHTVNLWMTVTRNEN